MADFAQVMKGWRRMCEKHAKMCDKCPLCNLECGAVPRNIKYHTDGQIEAIIMAWAAENPEPIYPTWADYITMLMIDDTFFRYDDDPITLGQWMNKTHISTELAQKLGLKPNDMVSGEALWPKALRKQENGERSGSKQEK